MRAKRAEKGQNLIIFLGCFGVSSGFSETKKGESKSIFEFEGQKGSICGASVAAFLGGSWGLFQALSGVLEGFRSHSPPVYENSPLPALWCNRFLGLLAKIRFKGILRGFIWVYRV